jgi:hypothetical protein
MMVFTGGERKNNLPSTSFSVPLPTEKLRLYQQQKTLAMRDFLMFDTRIVFGIVFFFPRGTSNL